MRPGPSPARARPRTTRLPRPIHEPPATHASIASSATEQDRSFWSFQPVGDPEPPPVADAAWPRSPIDRFILAQLEANGLAPAPPADKPTLIRRVTFDLIGLPPTPEEVDAFLRDDSPDAFATVVDRLLASPHYGERWGRHWLDVARYGEDQAHSFQPRLYPHGYRYRDWLIAGLQPRHALRPVRRRADRRRPARRPGPIGSTAWRPWASSPAGRSTTATPRSSTSTTTASTR